MSATPADAAGSSQHLPLHRTQSQDGADDIRGEIERQRETVRRQEAEMAELLTTARIEKTVLVEARRIIDGRIKDLQSELVHSRK